MLNPALNPAALATEYRAERRLLIRDILTPDIAARLERCLLEEVPWGLATLVDGKARNYKAEELNAMQPAEWQSLLRNAHRDACAGYQFFFNSYQMLPAYIEKRDTNLFLHRFLEYLNSSPMLDFVRQVTGHADIGKADAQATRYLPGHYLRRHNDIMRADPDDNRRAAYVFNLTRNWQADWGGQLQFLGDDAGVEKRGIRIFWLKQLSRS